MTATVHTHADINTGELFLSGPREIQQQKQLDSVHNTHCHLGIAADRSEKVLLISRNINFGIRKWNHHLDEQNTW